MPLAARGLLAVLALVHAGCRTKRDVDDLTTEAIGGLPDEVAQGVAEYRLRKPLGEASEGVLSSVTLLALLLVGKRRARSRRKVGARWPAGASEPHLHWGR